MPTPIGNSPTDQTFAQQLQAILTQMEANGDTTLANDFQTFATQFHSQYPQYTAQQALSAFLATELGGAVAAGVSATGGLLGQVPGTAASSLEKTSAVTAVNDVLGNFNLGSWFLRIGEILLGLVLVGVGVAKLTGTANFVSSAVKAKI